MRSSTDHRDHLSKFRSVAVNDDFAHVDSLIDDSTPNNSRKQQPTSFREPTNKMYAADPNYGISEKPWLPGLQTPYLIYNANLVDPRAGKIVEKMSLHLARGKVQKVAPTAEDEFMSDGREVIKVDAKDYYVCPGLIDCHVHLMAVHGAATLEGAFSFPHEMAMLRTAGTLRGILSNGFTTVRDTGGATIAHAQATEEFLIPGPRVFQCGRMLSQTGGHGDDTEVWNDTSCCKANGIAASALGRLCDGVPDCLRAARDNMRKGAQHLKNMGGTLVTAHCYTADGVRHAIAGGVRGIEHGNMIDRETAQLMAENGVFLTPTLALHTFVTMPPYDKFETPEGLRKNAIVGDAGNRAICYAEAAGVTVCFGTDTTGPTLIMQTYEFVVRSRLLPSPVVLRQATINGAKQVGMEGKLGEPVDGAFADLLFLKKNPLENVPSLDEVKDNLMLVMKDGRVVKSQVKGLHPERDSQTGTQNTSPAPRPKPKVWVYAQKRGSEDWADVYHFPDVELFPPDFDVLNHHAMTQSLWSRTVVSQKFVSDDGGVSLSGTLLLVRLSKEEQEAINGKATELNAPN
ncbi:amidohydrolase domain containing [Fusarium albosuccineum]|uniref:Amidohydrolase domain containing n=1 Tax=Fusarium albosuccineum TaxID=1237068 RepID=A0A8H4L4J9_9HYPO|nr:amidohydrolase domain containing [Fusarium albosuccineum]